MITAELDVTEDQLPDAVETLLGGPCRRRGTTWFDSTTPYPQRRVGQRQTASLTRRMPEVRLLARRLWPKLKWTTRRDVAPEEAGSSPAGHPIGAGDLGSAGPHTPRVAGSIPAPATILGRWRNQVAQLPCKEKVAGSSPARSTPLT